MSHPRGIIVLDGPDGVGKTTLANHLVQHHGAIRFHCVYRFRERIFTYHTSILRRAIRHSAERLVVVDRMWMSEAVYGHVYRGGTRWPHEGRMFDRMLRRFGALNVICVTDPAHVAAVVEERPGRDLYQDKERAGEVARHYAGLVEGRVTGTGNYLFELQHHGRRDDIVQYDYRIWKLDDIAAYLLDQLAAIRTRLSPLAADPSLMNLGGRLASGQHGGLADVTMMVGDQTNAKSPKVAWPFFDYGNSSLYLAEALSIAQIPEAALIWTNAFNDRFAEILATARALGVHRFVALGRAAETRLDETVPTDQIAPVRHPQAVRRFDHANITGYASELAAAVVLAATV